jgi:hypothetical protein
MNFRKLLTYLTVGTAAVIPFADAQNPTILQGSYISNVFGNSNFVKNPNAQTNVANVTNATRSITTPLVATSEFNLALDAGQNATWTLRAFDAGMKGQNCEARFSYRGFATATTTAEIVQNSLVVAQLVLTPSTDPRIASINFPCGDLANATTFRIAQTTANMTTVTPNEIGAIYTGLATNMANVAQAENVVQAFRNAAQTFSSGTPTAIQFNSETKDVYGEFDTANGRFTAKRAGDYLINSALLFDDLAWTAGQYYEISIRKNNSAACRVYKEVQNAITMFFGNEINCTITLAVGDYIETFVDQNRGSTASNASSSYTFTYISRFPTSSELVVTPERQNTWGGVVYTNSSQSLRTGQAASNTFYEFTGTQWDDGVLKGKAALTTTNSGQDLGFSIPNLPVGNYYLQARGIIVADVNASGSTTVGQRTQCAFRINETTTSNQVGVQAFEDKIAATTPVVTRDYPSIVSGIYTNTSVATRNFRLEAAKQSDIATSNGGACQAFSSNSGIFTDILFTITPLDQPSNSALYVEGPVKASATGAAIPAGYLGKAEFGGGNGSTTTSPANVYTISNVTPGVYMVRGYAAAQATGARTATYAGYGCTVTSNASLSLNWFDFLNVPQSNFGATGGTFTGFSLSNNYANSSSSIMQIVNVTSTTTYYVRCAIDTNNTGILVVAGAEFIRLN